MSAPPDRRRKGCPLCGKSSSLEHKPFCSRGCRDRDLLNWLGDSYRVPGPPAVENAEGGGAHQSSTLMGPGLDSEG